MGSPQYLKDKFGMGYTLEAKINGVSENRFIDVVKSLFGDNAVLRQNFSNHFVFNIPKDTIQSLARVFDALERSTNLICFL